MCSSDLCVEVRLTRAKTNHVAAFRLQRRLPNVEENLGRKHEAVADHADVWAVAEDGAQPPEEVGAIARQFLHALRQRDIEQINASFKRKSDEAERASKLLMSQKSLAWPDELFKKFQAKDGEALALLHNYRGLLIQKLGPGAKNVAFVMCCDDPHAERKHITAGDYLQVGLKLKYLEGG